MKNRKFIEWEKSMNNEIEIEGMGKIKFEKLGVKFSILLP